MGKEGTDRNMVERGQFLSVNDISDNIGGGDFKSIGFKLVGDCIIIYSVDSSGNVFIGTTHDVYLPEVP